MEELVRLLGLIYDELVSLREQSRSDADQIAQLIAKAEGQLHILNRRLER